MASSKTTSFEHLPPAPSAGGLTARALPELPSRLRSLFEQRPLMSSALRSAVAYFGRSEPASEQCEANR